jgi:phenylacetate-CoA ligase
MRVLRLLPRFQQAYCAVQCLAQREQWSRGQIETYQLNELNRLWQHAIQHVPYYRDLRAGHELPEKFTSLAEFQRSVPLLPKSVVRHAPDQFLSAEARPGCWERTSGSTGMPMSLYHDFAGHRTMQHAKYRLYDAWGIDILDRSAYLWSRADLFLPGLRGTVARWRMGIKDALRSRKRCSAFQLDKESLRSCLQELARFKPRALYGFSNAIFLLAQQASEQDFSTEWLKAVIMTSEPATPRMQAKVAAAFQAPVVVEYGATECELIAGTYPDGTVRVREDLVILEALPHAAGGFELAITVLTNSSFPLVRYQIGDIIDAPLKMLEQGFAILQGGISGRRDDLLRTREGGYLHASGVDALFENAFDSQAIRRYRAHQNSTGAIDMQIEIDPTRKLDFDLADLRQSIINLVEGYPVEIHLTTNLQRSGSAKHRAVTSDLSTAYLIPEDQQETCASGSGDCR